MDTSTDDIIQQAILSSEQRCDEPPPKRRRLNEPPSVSDVEEEGEDIFEIPRIPMDKHRRYLITCLKNIKRNNPNLDLHSNNELHKKLETINTEDLEIMMENAQIALGKLKPGETTESLLGLVGTGIEKKFTSLKGLKEKLVHDEELISAIDVYVPSFLNQLSLPLKIVYRFVTHVDDLLFSPSIPTESHIHSFSNHDQGTKRPRSSKPIEEPTYPTSGSGEVRDGENNTIA
jgi:hypothetical protein